MVVKVGVLGVPLDANSSHLFGCAEGPDAIRGALHSGSRNDSTEAGIEIVPMLDDLGNLDVVNVAGSRSDADLITDATRRQLATGNPLVVLGGDHSITYPILIAVAEKYANLTVVHIDAHPDTYDNFGDNPFSHASPFARAMEAGCMSSLIQLGIRTATAEGRQQAERFGIEMIAPREVHRFDAAALDGPLYLSLDLDGLDPSVAPGVSHHEPGGLTFREVLDIIDALPPTLIGADIVELNPSRDVHDMTAMVGAKLVKEVAAKLVESAS